MRVYARTAAAPRPERDLLITEHVEIARRIALRVARRVPDHVSRDDLVSAALLGLAEAAERFDVARGEPFLGFAEKRIRGAVLDELRRGDLMPRRARQMARKVGTAIRELEHTLGRTPEDDEVAVRLGVTTAEYQENLEQLVHVTVGVLDDDLRIAEDGASPLVQSEHTQLMARVRGALGRLDQRDALLLSLYYIEELTYAEIADVLGVTTSRVCQLHGRAIARLRSEIESPSTTPSTQEAAHG